MSPETYQWIKAGHAVGFLLWTGGLLACIQLLIAHAGAGSEGRGHLVVTARKTAMIMDMGALLAMVAGFYLALATTPNQFTNGGWLHIKLTVVVLGLLGLHGFVRVKIRKYRNGDVRALPGFVLPVTLLVVSALVLTASLKPFAKVG
ncbi:MAG: CopD family protein [Myxococcota bacterium]